MALLPAPGNLLLVGMVVYFAWDAVHGLRRGRTVMIYREVKRSEDPVGFWTFVLLSAVFAVGAAAFLILRIIHR
jgi:hypothetical protein